VVDPREGGQFSSGDKGSFLKERFLSRQRSSKRSTILELQPCHDLIADARSRQGSVKTGEAAEEKP
jgi:hypothetical protein